jgi:hypothetical protein
MTTIEKIHQRYVEIKPDHVPEVAAVIDRSGTQFTVGCRFCKRDHYHGAVAYGFRVSHCTDSAKVGTYFLVPPRPMEMKGTVTPNRKRHR